MIYLKFRNTETNAEKRSIQVVRCLTIGSGTLADIQITDDGKISRLHALVVPRPDGRLELRDLGSSGGTFVTDRGMMRRLMPEPGHEGAKKGRATLAVGEKFFIGGYCAELHYDELLGEPTVQQIPVEEEEEITDFEKMEKLK